MDLSKQQSRLHYFEKVETVLHREFINAHNNCVLCGTVLELRHIRLEDDRAVKEEAHCTHCDLRTRAKVYTLS
jgi:hypothetical protein